MINNFKSRRNFLKQCALTHAAGYTGALSALGGLSLTAQAQSSSIVRPTEYRAMVCVYLTGGNDLNMLMPTDDDTYAAYNEIRGKSINESGQQIDKGLTLLREDDGSGDEVFIPISSGSGDNRRAYGLHPSCGVVSDAAAAGSGGFNKLYNDGKLAFITNTGALIQPTTAEQFRNKSVPVPPSLFNHLIQKDFVRAGQEAIESGWAGRIADYFDGQRTNSPMNLSFTGDNVWQRGVDTSTYGTSGASVPALVGYRHVGGLKSIR